MLRWTGSKAGILLTAWESDAPQMDGSGWGVPARAGRSLPPSAMIGYRAKAEALPIEKMVECR